MHALQQLWAGRRDLVLIALVMGVLMLLFVPVPSPVLDFLLITNISMALLVLLVTFFIETPLKFSTFPTLLLLSTLFRLALNVSATRLILEGADAGRVIGAIGEFVVGGNYIVGVVVFLILVVVQYVVVTSGAQRVAEVAARFTLDSMPGKQMSIDADMNMGLIDEKEARSRRALVEREANFYGAMDGATKFVKGDAIAGIIIIGVNIVGGLAIGIAQMGLPWADAVQRFTLLTIGDGIVTQIPSLVIAVATGIIITRAAADAQLGTEIPRQMLANPRALLIVGVVLLVAMLLPGFPKLPVIAVLVVLCGLAFLSIRGAEQRGPATRSDAPETERTAGDELRQLLRIEPLELRYGSALAPMLAGPDSDFQDRIATLRKQVLVELGFVAPKLSLSLGADLKGTDYEVYVNGVRTGGGELMHDQVLAINPGGARQPLDGKPTKEPAYGLPAQWIERGMKVQARAAGYTLVEPDTVLVTHLTELLRRQAPELLTRNGVEQMIQRDRERLGPLADEIVPAVMTYSEIQKVLQLLLREQVSIRNLEAILEVLADAGRAIKAPEELAERVRERLGASICQGYRDGDGRLQVLTIAPELERTLLAATRSGDGRSAPFGEAAHFDAFMKNLTDHVEAMMGRSLVPVLLCPSPLRRTLRSVLHRSMPFVAVIGVNEVPADFAVHSFASVQVS
ncbi:flagellar biosynthesis protein FlhA [Arenimonas terrae]|uniref:Flagellar type III secretion system protein FlhA n=1 Tax=Arenimonas terrae TaxID=2546226 RepID=A0A5C4RQJ6_9GAMM|nr:flagellar biosynthesis protein FlhA [Arenimonas terrae]TNJ33244.1 flagellar type III secretion system protein FlhA [Arenimonas terrae]